MSAKPDRKWSIRRAGPETRYPGKHVPDRLLVCRLTRVERRAVYEALDRIASPGVMHREGTASRAAALGWLCQWDQLWPAPALTEAGPTKSAKFWIYAGDVILVREQMRQAQGNLGRIAARFLKDCSERGEQGIPALPAGGQPLGTWVGGVPDETPGNVAEDQPHG